MSTLKIKTFYFNSNRNAIESHENFLRFCVIYPIKSSEFIYFVWAQFFQNTPYDTQFPIISRKRKPLLFSIPWKDLSELIAVAIRFYVCICLTFRDWEQKWGQEDLTLLCETRQSISQHIFRQKQLGILNVKGETIRPTPRLKHFDGSKRGFQQRCWHLK